MELLLNVLVSIALTSNGTELRVVPSGSNTTSTSQLLNLYVNTELISNGTELHVVSTGSNSTGSMRELPNLNIHIDKNCGYKKNNIVSDHFGIMTTDIPWRAGIYDKRRKYIIGTGTLISKRVIVTAAVYGDGYYVTPVSKYLVAVGNIDCDMKLLRDSDSQTSDIERVIFHPNFTRNQRRIQNNLALVIAAKEFSYTENVRPACLSFDPKLDAALLHRAADKDAELLTWDTCNRELSVSYVGPEECKAQLENTYGNPDINEDTFCAKGFGKGWQCAAGYGGGIVFPARVGGSERYFLRGVFKPADTVNGETGMFTHLLHYDKFINSALDK